MSDVLNFNTSNDYRQSQLGITKILNISLSLKHFTTPNTSPVVFYNMIYLLPVSEYPGKQSRNADNGLAIYVTALKFKSKVWKSAFLVSLLNHPST